MATVQQKKVVEDEEADLKKRKFNERLEVFLKILLVVGETLACLGMIYYVGSFLLKKRTFMSLNYLDVELKNGHWTLNNGTENCTTAVYLKELTAAGVQMSNVGL